MVEGMDAFSKFTYIMLGAAADQRRLNILSKCSLITGFTEDFVCGGCSAAHTRDSTFYRKYGVSLPAPSLTRQLIAVSVVVKRLIFNACSVGRCVSLQTTLR
jgi:hypothetical protein